MKQEPYPGTKSASGIQQWIINKIPVHIRYFELFAGRAKISLVKRRSLFSMLNDIDAAVIADLQQSGQFPRFNFQNTDAVEIIKRPQLYHPGGKFDRSCFLFLDPPYPETSRRSGRAYYRHEMLPDCEHVPLLRAIKEADANIMICTRQNDLYDKMLCDWKKEKFQTRDRVGNAEEIIYMNYSAPPLLHQYDYLGNGFIDRQRIKRKISRFSDKIQELPEYEKHLFILELIKNDTTAVKHFLSMAASNI